MKKTILSLFLLFALCANPAASQSYYFYNYKEIVILNPVNNYLAVRFKDGVGKRKKRAYFTSF